eukprot:TRINITY_DN6371_c0_g1_i1.p1 TRINITY_DN6371_c0_g1~~TRINITY_DN6371_c0_g1_i1.p1  ORF type:complete len:256 (+),score=50.58 TRINITY_DN6371_c0_g1_i1:25-768(+)
MSLLTGVFSTVGSSIKAIGKALDETGSRLQGSGVHQLNSQVSNHRRLVPLYSKVSTIGVDTFVAPDACVVGAAKIGKNSALWYGAIIRGDVDPVTIGDNVSIGERAVVHIPTSTTPNGSQTIIGDNVDLGVGAIVQGATIKKNATIQAGAIITAGSVVGEGAVIAAGSFLPPGTQVPTEELWSGSPANFVRKLSEDELSANEKHHESVMVNAEKHDYWHSLTNEQKKMLDLEGEFGLPKETKPAAVF